jgi:hypothetical protein
MKTKNLNELYFPVEKVPMSTILPGYSHISGLSHATMVTLPDGIPQIINYCSDDYFLVKNEDVIPPFLKEISRFYEVDTSIKSYRYSRFYIDVIIKVKELAMSAKDKVYARVRIVNSYDGSVKYHYEMGFWRQICKNGLMGFTNWDSITRMHTPGLEDLANFSGIMEMVSMFLAESDDHFQRYHFLDDQKVKNPLLRIEEVADETDFPKSLLEDVTERLEIEKGLLETSQVTDWLVYNAFNYQLNHAEDYKAKEEKKAKIDNQIFQYLLNY